MGRAQIPLPKFSAVLRISPSCQTPLRSRKSRRVIVAAVWHLALSGASAGRLAMSGPSLRRGPCRYSGP
eukprot:11163017-Lingulodinium_polyedra.AAC.1